MEAIKIKAAELITVFQCAILELSAKLESDQASISVQDRESTEYVIGMAQVTSVNLNQVVKLGAEYYGSNKEKVERLFAEASEFADSLKKEGYGLLEVVM